jgi:ubiquinone/menaquinone biosynthesis C-methylase UbiE
LKTDIAGYSRATFNQRAVVESYRRADELQPPEAAIMSWIGHDFAGKRILDLGVGAGRTTPFLLEISRDYVGIDFSPAMVEACRTRYPTVEFAVGDARDLSRFPDASFDFVMFSHNGIDCIDHPGRLQVLAEIRRVLSSGGVFVFSTLNRNAKRPRSWGIRRLRQPDLSATPFLLFKRLRLSAAGIYHDLKHRSQQTHTEEYAVVTTDIFNYDMLLYTITIDAQLTQLRRVGFHDVAVVGYTDARVLQPGEYASRKDPWLYYACGSIKSLGLSPSSA